MIDEVNLIDLEEPPKNKLRKVIFKYGNNLTKKDKLEQQGR